MPHRTWRSVVVSMCLPIFLLAGGMSGDVEGASPEARKKHTRKIGKISSPGIQVPTEQTDTAERSRVDPDGDRIREDRAVPTSTPGSAGDSRSVVSRSDDRREDRNVLSPGVPSILRAVPVTCDEATSEERIKCKAGNVMDQAEDTTTMIMMMEGIPDNQKHALMEETMRARRMEGRAPSDDFKQMMKKKAKCQVVEQDAIGTIGETDGNNDGICTGNEICAEAKGDGIGNDDDECEPRNGKNREMCAEICDEEGQSIDENLDAAVGQELEAELDRATSNFMELNDALEEEMVLRARVNQLVEDDDPCAAVMVGGMSRPPNVNERFSSLALGTTLVVRDFQSLQADLADKVCSIDGAGFNAKVVCAVFEAFRAIAINLATIQEIHRDNITGETMDISFQCIKKLDQEVGETTGLLDAIKAKVMTLEQQLADAKRETIEVIDLIRTPPGRRPDYPLP